MSELISIENYQSNLQYIDKDHTASMFMATCELNKVYSEYDYKLFVAMECFNVDSKSIEDSIYDMWGDINDYEPEIQYIIAEMIQQQIIESKKQKAQQEWEKIKNEKIMDIGFKYPSSWTYNDVLLYFQKHGFPKYRPSQSEILESNMNVCKARHILRNDILTDESILISFIEMWERKKDIEAYQKEQEVWQIFMMIVSAILMIVAIATPFLQPLSGWALGAAITGAITSAGSLGLSIYNFVAAKQNAAAMEEITKQTNDLMLKNMPKAGNFVDTAITDPYAMYANGRLYKQGGAGQERYDSMLPHEPYRYLDDRFKDSDMYDILNNKIDKFAGGDDYLPSLYRDAKWTNPKAMKTLLNGAIPIYLSQRTKTIEAIFKWLSKEGLGTYYLYEKYWRDDDENVSNYDKIEFQDSSEAFGFYKLETIYDYKYVEIENVLDSNGNLTTQEVVKLTELRENFNVDTSWDKNDDEKIEKKTSSITSNNRVVFVKEETKIFKGSEIKLERKYVKVIQGGEGSTETTWQTFLDSNTKYEFTYKLYKYGGKEVRIYSKIINLDSMESLDITYKHINAPQDYIWRIRGEHSIYIRFKPRSCLCAYCSDLFINEETKQHTIPHITRNGDIESYFRYFDKGNMFGTWEKHKINLPSWIIEIVPKKLKATATTQAKDFTKVTIYSTKAEQIENLIKAFGKDSLAAIIMGWNFEYFVKSTTNFTDYFGINPFLNAKRMVTFF